MTASNFLSVVGVDSVRRVALVVVAGLAVAGCGGGETTEENSSADVAATEQRSASAMGVNAQAVATWSKIADEGASYQVLNAVPVRFGAGTKWVKLRVSGSFVCSAAAFGIDPAPGAAKSCEARNVAGVGNAKLAWTPSGDAAVTGYRVYYGGTSGGYLQVPGSGVSAGSNSSFSIVGLDASQKFYFAVTSINAAGVESDFSNEASALIAD